MFGDKEFGKHVGYPTPEETPIDSTCLTFNVPANSAWWAIITGLVLTLTEEENWQQFEGGMTPEQAAEDAFDFITAALDVAAMTDGCGTDMIQAPYWDDESGDDADDEATPDEQTWYGQWDGETFTETLSYVFLTNFLSTLVSPQAAIRFLTIPRAFRVAIRQNPHGANLLLFLDGGLYKLINGYSPVDKVVEFLIASPGTELLLVHDGTHDPSATPNENGDYVVDVIRKRLALDQVEPPNVRYYGTPPIYQVSQDDGVTWEDQPSADPRYAAPSFFPPLNNYSGIECDVAARMTAQLHDCINMMCDVADAAQAVTGLLELILLPEGLVGAMLSLLFTIADQIIDNGQATVLAAFTDAVYDDVRCSLVCFINPDGSITQEALDEAWEQVKTLHAGTVATVIDEVRFLFSDAVFTNAGVKRTETGDCSDCDPCSWRWEWKDNTLRDEWTAYPFQSCYGGSYPALAGYFQPNGTAGFYHSDNASGRAFVGIGANFTIPDGVTVTKLGFNWAVDSGNSDTMIMDLAYTWMAHLFLLILEMVFSN